MSKEERIAQLQAAQELIQKQISDLLAAEARNEAPTEKYGVATQFNSAVVPSVITVQESPLM